jgi:hypothetical protein
LTLQAGVGKSWKLGTNPSGIKGLHHHPHVNLVVVADSYRVSRHTPQDPASPHYAAKTGGTAPEPPVFYTKQIKNRAFAATTA